MTMAPMLSAYLATKSETKKKWAIVRGFDRFQTWLEERYGDLLKWTLKRPLVVVLSAVALFVVSIVSTKYVSKTFLPPQDTGEFAVAVDLPPGTSLEAMARVADKTDEILRAHPEVVSTIKIIGGNNGEANEASFFVNMVPARDRKMNTSEFKEILRQDLKVLSYANPKVKDIDAVGGGLRPFNVNIAGTDLHTVEKISQEAFEKIRLLPGLKDADISYRPGKPEFQVALDQRRSAQLGVSSALVGQELRTQMEGTVAAQYRENGQEYDIRVRLKEDQRDLRKGFEQTFVPNINQSLIRIGQVAHPVETKGPATILRQDRQRYVQISADLASNGPGLSESMQAVSQIMTQDVKLPTGYTYSFLGQAENFQELAESMITAVTLGILFIFLVLASLYESFITPFAIMLVLPLAIVGAFLALLVTGKSLNLFSMIGCVMLLGIATKNSILLVDYTNQLLEKGMERTEALILAGKTRLRPILMTTVALITGMLPVAIGLNEASRQRTSMGVAIIGGLISSTVLSLIVVPAAFTYIDRFRTWSGKKIKRVVQGEDAEIESGALKKHAPSRSEVETEH